MRILYVVPNVPSPVRPRPFNFIRGLCNNHEVSLLCLVTNEIDRHFASQLSQLCSDSETVHLTRWRSFWNCFVALFSGTPLRYAYFYSPALRDRLKQKIGGGKFDLLHAEHLKSMPMLDGVTGQVASVLDAVDCVSMFESRRLALVKNPLLRGFFRTEMKKMQRCERDACKDFDQLVITSAADKRSYPVPDSVKSKLNVVPNGVDLEYFAFRRFEPVRNSIIFCAKLDYFPNADAALYFAREIWPLLSVRRPGLRFEIVGSRPPRIIRRLNGFGNVRVIGSVEDVRPFLGRAWVALCPLRVQAGIQNKILEAMAMGVPVIATRISCTGLGVEPGNELLVAETPAEFVSGIELLLDNVNLRDELIKSGREYVEKNHSWAVCVRQLVATYEQAQSHFQRTTREPALAS